MRFGGSAIYVDPYLTDYVAEVEGEHMRRLIPPPFPARSVTDATAVLLTHPHIDHCDPTTLVDIALASPQARFWGPVSCVDIVRSLGVSDERVTIAAEEWTSLAATIRFRTVPAAHPVVARTPTGELEAVGYVVEFGRRRIYHSGDCSPDRDVIKTVKALGPIDVAFLPVNERNYVREEAGILGNMSVREAFQVAADIGVSTLVPIHWDLFAPNRTHQQEIEMLYRLEKPPFNLAISPSEI